MAIRDEIRGPWYWDGETKPLTENTEIWKRLNDKYIDFSKYYIYHNTTYYSFPWYYGKNDNSMDMYGYGWKDIEGYYDGDDYQYNDEFTLNAQIRNISNYVFEYNDGNGKRPFYVRLAEPGTLLAFSQNESLTSFRSISPNNDSNLNFKSWSRENSSATNDLTITISRNPEYLQITWGSNSIEYWKDSFVDNTVPERLFIEIQAAGGGGARGRSAFVDPSGGGGGGGAYGLFEIKFDYTSVFKIILGHKGSGGTSSKECENHANDSYIQFGESGTTVWTIGGGKGSTNYSGGQYGAGGRCSYSGLSGYVSNYINADGANGGDEWNAGGSITGEQSIISSFRQTLTFSGTRTGGSSGEVWGGGGGASFLGTGGRGGQNGADGGNSLFILHLPILNN